MPAPRPADQGALERFFFGAGGDEPKEDPALTARQLANPWVSFKCVIVSRPGLFRVGYTVVPSAWSAAASPPSARAAPRRQSRPRLRRRR